MPPVTRFRLLSPSAAAGSCPASPKQAVLTPEKAERQDGRIVNLRALAILLVVFGHSIILYQNSWSLYSTVRAVPALDLVKRWIDLIQMPLFFSLSGYLFDARRSKTSLAELLSKKAKRLLLPFLSFALFWMVPIRLLVGYPGYQNRNLWDILWNSVILGSDCGHLWFLPCLFFCFVLTWGVFRLLGAMKLTSSVVYGVLFLAAYAAARYSCRIPGFPGSAVVRNVALNWVWFCAGLLLCRFGDRMELLRKCKIIFLLAAIGCSAASLLRLLPYDRVTGMLLLLTLYLWTPEGTTPFTGFLSNHSFGIYLFHSPLIYLTCSQIPDAHPCIVILLNFVGFGGLSALLTAAMRKTKMKRFLGE